MGQVLVAVKIENILDLYQASRGLIPADQVREVKVEHALVDTGATTLSMPKKLIDQLGLKVVRSQRVRTAAGTVIAQIFEAVRLTIQDRDCSIDVTSLPEECPVLIGQVPLELLDLVVDPLHHQLIGNPLHGGEHIMEFY